jgi:3-oxoacyl-[acyl-carrier protein] reductase
MDLKSTKAIVTGGASGMGREFTLSLARDGATVSFCDLDEAKIAEVVAEAADLPGKVYGFVADVSKEDQVVKLIADASAAMGGLNALVNNAGLFRDGLLVKKDKDSGDIKKMSLANWQKVIDVDLTGPFLCTREFAAHMLATGTKSSVVIAISSVSRHGNPGQTNYSAAKAGLIADTKLWAQELSRYGIRTGAVAPGFIQTPILDGMKPEALAMMVKAVPLGRTGTPREIYLAVKFIIECDYFTGRCVDVDGGLMV